jgi:DNA-binding HxlR family transcriptional regulator
VQRIARNHQPGNIDPKSMTASNDFKVLNDTAILNHAMHLIGGKWKIVILYQIKLMPKRYSELLKEIKGITEMTLSLQLKQLEKDGLISRNVSIKQSPIKVFYSLTNFGSTVIPALDVIADWAYQIAQQQTSE